MNIKLFFGVSCFLSVGLMTGQNQDYVSLMQDKDARFEQVQAAFENYWKGKTPGKGTGYKAFKRYEDFIKNRLNPVSGRFENATSTFIEYKKYFNGNAQSRSSVVQNLWSPVKPSISYPVGGGAGRVNCIAFHPNNTNIVFIGAPAGGIWRSYDGGFTWTTNTDDFASLGVSDIAFNPKNPNIVYAATGDRDAGDSYAIGVLKSTDGGITWNVTGNAMSTGSQKSFSRLLIHPDNPDTLLVAGSDGVFKTYNGGGSWTQKLSSSIKDMEFKPGDPNTVYASGVSMFRSVNNGETFGTIASLSSPTRIALAVTAANSNYVYAIAVNATNGLQGIYRSTNSGVSFTLRSASPNVLSASGGGTDGQGWYDLAIAASPTNANEIYTGGVALYKSLNGGQNMFLMNSLSRNAPQPYIHADIHDVTYNADGDFWVGCDGGVFNTYDFASSFNDLSSNLAIGQMYRISTSQLDTSLTITGWQDNGTSLYENNAASFVLGGDGMECQVNQSNSNVVYGGIQNGLIFRSGNKGASFTNIASDAGTGVNSFGAWVTPYALDPTNQNTVYLGKAQLYESTNSGTTWAQLGTLPGSNNADQIAISNDVLNKNIYVSKGAGLFVKKGAAAFAAITTGLPSNSITDIEVSPNDKNKVWVTFSGYNSNSRIFYSNNAGTTWTNISAGLPQVPTNCIIHEKNTPNIYVGTDIGVFYKDTTSASWVPYGIGLPNVPVNDLDIQYNLGRLRVGTYGRGLWETKVFQLPNVAPVASFSVSQQVVCKTQTAVFTDNSSNSPTARTWSFTGGTPSTSNLFNPTVTYNTAGVYPVKLVVSNGVGSDSVTQTNYITVNAGPNVSVDSSTILKCKYDDTVSFVGFGALNYNWSPSAGVSSSSNGVFNCFSQLPGIYIIKGFDAAGCFGIDTVVVSLKQPPFSLTIANIAGGFRVVSSNPPSTTSYQWFVNGAAIANANNDTLFANGQGAYTCQVTISNGCKRTSTNTINFTALNTVLNTTTTIDVLPNPNTGKFVLKIEGQENLGQLEITDILGRRMSTQSLEGTQLNKALTIVNAGVYFITVKNKSGKTIGIKKVMVE